MRLFLDQLVCLNNNKKLQNLSTKIQCNQQLTQTLKL